jgi:hypothetical protein
MTLPQQDAVDAARRRQFAPEMIDPRVLGAHVDRATGERTFGPGGDVARLPWPPRSGGPLPKRLPPDLNIGTAQDEIDAWAHEHDAATELLAELRSELAMTGPDGTDSVEIRVMKAKARYRREARQSPVERGRRTAEDISEEVNEKLAEDEAFLRKLDLETSIGIALDRLFRAKSNIERLQRYIDTLPRIPTGP